MRRRDIAVGAGRGGAGREEEKERVGAGREEEKEGIGAGRAANPREVSGGGWCGSGHWCPRSLAGRGLSGLSVAGA